MPPGVTLPQFPGLPNMGNLAGGPRGRARRDPFSAIPSAAPAARAAPTSIQARPLRAIDFPMPKLPPGASEPQAKAIDASGQPVFNPWDQWEELFSGGPFDPIGGLQALGRLGQHFIAPGSVTSFPGSQPALAGTIGAPVSPSVPLDGAMNLSTPSGQVFEINQPVFDAFQQGGGLGAFLSDFDPAASGLPSDILKNATFAHMPYFENLGVRGMYLDEGQIKALERRYLQLLGDKPALSDEEQFQFWTEAALFGDIAIQRHTDREQQRLGLRYGREAIDRFNMWDENASASLTGDASYQMLMQRASEDALGAEFVDAVVQAARPALDNMVGQDAANYASAMDSGGGIQISGLAGQLAHQSRIAGLSAEVGLRGEAEISRQDFNQRSRQFYAGEASRFRGQRYAQFYSAASSVLSFDQLMAQMQGTTFAAATGIGDILPLQLGFDFGEEEVAALEQFNDPIYQFVMGIGDLILNSGAQYAAGAIPEFFQDVIGG